MCCCRHCFCRRVWRSDDTWYHSSHSHKRMARSLGMSQSLIDRFPSTRPPRIIHVVTREFMVQSSNYRKCVAICWPNSPRELLAHPPAIACSAKLMHAVRSGCIFFTLFLANGIAMRHVSERQISSNCCIHCAADAARLFCRLFFCKAPWSLLKSDLVWDTSSLHSFFSVPHPSRMVPYGPPSCFSWLSTVTNMKCVATTRNPMGPGCSFQIRLQSLFTTLVEPR